MLNFFTKALIKRQLKDVPESEIEKMFAVIEKNPDYFKQLAERVQEKVKQGMSQEEAVRSLMQTDDGVIQNMWKS